MRRSSRYPVRLLTALPLAYCMLGAQGLPGVNAAAARQATGAVAAMTTDTQFADSPTSIRLYNAAIGYPQHGTALDLAGWFRDPTLPTTGALPVATQPRHVTYSLQIAPSTAAVDTASTPLVALANEDTVTLGLDPVSLDGQKPLAVFGQSDGSEVNFPGVVTTTPVTGTTAAAIDVAIKPTIRGIRTRVVLHSADQGGSLVFAIDLDPRTHLVRQANGTILVEQDIPQFGDNGSQAGVVQQPEYVLEPPVVQDSGPVPAAAVAVAPTTVTLGVAPTSSSGGEQTVTVQVDPSWLQDPRRVFPVHVDLPIVTGLAGLRPGLFGTVISCAPDRPAPLTDMVVGMVNGCTYDGRAYFDVSSILPGTPIQSAVLNLYTPDQTSATGVTVYPNTPPNSDQLYAPAAWDTPTWRTAPPVPGSGGLSQRGSNAHWQQWDLTALVRSWVNDRRHMNGGLTLTSTGMPVAFASPFGTAVSDPQRAPYIEVTFPSGASAPPLSIDGVPESALRAPFPAALTGPGTDGLSGAIQPQYSDNSYSIFGISGGIKPNNSCPGGPACTGGINISTIGNPLDAQYARIDAMLECDTISPGYSWWNSSSQRVFLLMRDAYNDGLVPVIDFNETDSCPAAPQDWTNQMTDFVATLYQLPSIPGAPSIHYPLYLTYFEIQNEPSLHPNYSSYTQSYAAAAAALYSQLEIRSTTNFRILTGGDIKPSVGTNSEVNGGTCTDPQYTTASINVMLQANTAAYNNRRGVPQDHMGAAVHPYSYTEWAGYGFYQNYYSRSGILNYPPVHRVTGDPCFQLDSMLYEWTSSFSNQPVVISEINYQSKPNLVNVCNDYAKDRPSYGNTYPGYPTDYYARCVNSSTDQNNDAQSAEGNYLADLITFLADFYYANPSNSPVRALWFTGANQAPDPDLLHRLGLWNYNGSVQYIDDRQAGGLYCPNISNLNGMGPSEDYIYSQMVLKVRQSPTTGCY